MKDYYYLLGLKQTATLDDIKNSYRRLSKKFHPDVNDGDAFFAERFKDIQEAYELLSNPERRKIYDLKYSNKSETSSNNSNFTPEIEFFTSDKSGIHIGDDITFKWKTINADVVVLEPLGPVKPIGEITYKIRNVKVNKINFKIVAVNSNIDRKVEKQIVVNNLTYDEIYKEAYDDIKREMNSKSHDHKSGNNFSFSKDSDDEFNLEYDPAGKLKAVVSFILAIGVGIFILSRFY
jgi:curved DNA-binding protein CbpA